MSDWMLGRCLSSMSLFAAGFFPLLLPSGYSVSYILMFCVGLFSWFFYCGKVTVAVVPRDLWRHLIFPLLAFAVTNFVLSVVIHQDSVGRSFDVYGRYMAVFFIIYGLFIWRPRTVFLWLGLCGGLVLLFVISMTRWIPHYLDPPRVSGFMNAIQFGDLAMLFGSFCFCAALYFWQHSNRWIRLFCVFSGVLGICLSFLSGSRGGWLALPLTFFLFLYTFYSMNILSFRRLLMWAVFGVMLVMMIVYSDMFGVRQRLDEAKTEWQQYMDKGVPYQRHDSIGSRLAMWNLSLRLISERVLWGWGQEGYLERRDDLIRKKEVSPYIQPYAYVHQEFLDAWVKRGLVGFLSLIALYVMPFLFFRKYYVQSKVFHSLQLKALALAGMLLPSSFALFGLTQVFLAHNSGRMVYIVWVSALAVLCVLEARRTYEEHCVPVRGIDV